MKKLIVTFLVLFLAIWLGYLIHRDPGYILVTYRTWSVETSLWVGTTILILAFLIVYFLLRLFSHTSKLAHYAFIWHKERRERQAGKQMHQAFDAFIEMRWKDAENTLIKSAKYSTSPIINYTAAAYAAQQQGDTAHRDDYLKQLDLQSNTSDKTAKLAQAYFYIHAQQWPSALKVLRALQDHHANDPAVIQYLAQTFMALEEWSALQSILPNLSKACDSPALQPLKIQLYHASLRHAPDITSLDDIWKVIPKILRTHTAIVSCYAQKTNAFSQPNKGIRAIEAAARKNWHIDLPAAYGQLVTDDLHPQIRQAESWLKQHPNEAPLLLCLGRLCLKEKLWGKARDYLNQSLNLTPNAATHHALGQLFETLDEPKTAMTHYKQASEAQS